MNKAQGLKRCLGWRRAVQRMSFWGIVFASAIAPHAAQAETCDPKGGDQFLTWVNDNAGRLSRQLARADFEVRTFNLALLGHDDIHERLKSAIAKLDMIAQRIRTSESADSEITAVAAAIKRERDSQDLLNDLLSLRAVLDDLHHRRQVLEEPLTRQAFRALGLPNVGRSTLVSSLQELGDTTQNRLATRYDFYVSVSWDSTGRVTDAKAGRVSGDMWDGIATAGASYFGPYAPIVLVTYGLLRLQIEDESCQAKINAQRRKVTEALERLPQVLITADEQFNAYLGFHDATRLKFKDHAALLKNLQNAVDERWQALFAYNAARNSAAHSILTAEKINALRRSFESDDTISSIFRNFALAEVAADITNFNRYLSKQHSMLLLACGNVDGLAVGEDQSDALEFALKAYQSFRQQASFAPLHRMLDISSTWLSAAQKEATDLRRQLGVRLCDTQTQTDERAVYEMFMQSIDKERLKFRTSQNRFAEILEPTSHFQSPEVDAVPNSCTLVTPGGGLYRCASGDADGSPYRNRFYRDGDDPMFNVLGGAADGGYSEDNRQISSEISKVDQNLSERIARLKHEFQNISSALPAWTDRNAVALNAWISDSRAREDREAAERLVFTERIKPILEDAGIFIDEFLASPVDEARIEQLVQRVGGSEMSLPSLPPDSLVADAPRLKGISAVEKVYGDRTTVIQRAIHREALKVDRDLSGDSKATTLAQEALSIAETFAASGTAQGVTYANYLIRDSSAIRYWKLGELPNLRIAAVSAEGLIERRVIADIESLAAETLIANNREFQTRYSLFQSQLKSVEGGLRDDAPNRDRRLVITRTAETIALSAKRSFYSGDLSDGITLLQMAYAVLDVATNFVPGVSWGRDVFEAISGHDLFTGDELNTVSRSVAVLGAITAGIGDKGFKALRALRRITDLGHSAERAEEIIKSSRTIVRADLRMSSEAIQRMLERNISESEVEHTIDFGTRFWDTQNESMTIFEVDFSGPSRVGAAVNIDTRFINTVFWEQASDEALGAIEWIRNGQPIRRFIKLIDE